MCLVNLHEILQAVIVCSPLLAEWSPESVVMEMPRGWKCFLNQRTGRKINKSELWMDFARRGKHGILPANHLLSFLFILQKCWSLTTWWHLKASPTARLTTLSCWTRRKEGSWSGPKTTSSLSTSSISGIIHRYKPMSDYSISPSGFCFFPKRKTLSDRL